MNIKQIWVNISFIVKNLIGILRLSREKKIANLLIRNALKLSTAESCTGGLISSRMTDLSGSSAYIFQNFVTYSNKSKEELLGVSPKTIEKFGVVSAEVAKEMAIGLLNRYNCTIALSITGIAGPLGATENKPVGLVYIGIADEKKQESYRFEANPLLYRRIMKYAFSNEALNLLIDFLKENY